MSLASANESVQPCLFDRLTDDRPGEQKESRAERTLSKNRLLEAIMRDLRWLLNCSSHLEDEGLDEFPEVEKSVMNFGQRGYTGSSLSNLEPSMVEKAIERAIQRYEPRVDPATLKVTCVSVTGQGKGRYFKPHGAYNCLSFEIAGELRSQPVPEEFLLKTSLDLETGLQVT